MKRSYLLVTYLLPLEPSNLRTLLSLDPDALRLFLGTSFLKLLRQDVNQPLLLVSTFPLAIKHRLPQIAQIHMLKLPLPAYLWKRTGVRMFGSFAGLLASILRMIFEGGI
jgi:hypothetical protein